MSLIYVILVIAVIGLIVWAITTFIPMPASFKTAILVIALLCLILWLCQAFGLLDRASDVRVPRIE